MTMQVNVAHHGPASYVTVVTVEDRVFDFVTQKHTDEWRKAEEFQLVAGQHRGVYLHSTRRLTVTEIAAPAPPAESPPKEVG